MKPLTAPASPPIQREVYSREYRDPDAYVTGNGLVTSRLARPLSSKFHARAMGIGMAERTLHLACLEFLGMGAMPVGDATP